LEIGMAKARPLRWLHPALLLAAAALIATTVRGAPSPGSAEQKRQLAVQAAAVAWPVSDGLVVGEVVTGATSASDEFVEIYNAAATDRDLGGLEIVYVTATGSTVTRKQTWTQLILPAHRHLLLANSSGKWASGADGLYSGGFAATGGSLVLRTLGGTVIDSLSWGDATNSFVEGAAALAPAAGSSLERKPGGVAGNGTDTNDNLADSRVEANPVPQTLLSAPVPAASPSQVPTPAPTAVSPTTTPITTTPSPTIEPTPSEAPTESCTPEPTPTASPSPSPTPTASPPPSPDPSQTSSATATLAETAAPTATPAATPASSGTPTPAPQPTATPVATPTATPTVMPTLNLAQVRDLALGSVVTVHGQLTTPTGMLNSGTTTFIEDSTAGIALRLTSADWPSAAIGTQVSAIGLLATHDGQLTVDIANSSDFAAGALGPLTDPLLVATGLACEPFEARTIAVEGTVTVGGFMLADGGTATAIDDGTGPLTIIAAPASLVGGGEFAVGSRVHVSGVLGQFDPFGSGGGYRLYVRSISDVVLVAPPPTPTPSPTPAPTPSPSPTPTQSPSPTPTPTQAPVSIAFARTQAVGSRVVIRGTVTVGPGWILGDSTVGIQDATGGIYVKFIDPPLDLVVPGREVIVNGVLASPYGNLELRPASDGVQILDMVTPPTPRALDAAEIGESTEGLLARVSVTVKTIEPSSSGSLTLIVEDGSGEGRIYAHAPLGLAREDFFVGERLSVIGLVGDRLSLYRLWPRNRFDITAVIDDPTSTPTPAPTATRSPTSTPTPTRTPTSTPTGQPTATPTQGSGDGQAIGIGDALRLQGQTVTVVGTVTTRQGLLDTDGYRVTVQDSTGAILVRLPNDFETQTGQRLKLSGEVGTYYGAPQVTAELASRTGEASVEPLSVRGGPFAAGVEWRLVTVSGTVESLHRDGDAWRAELTLATGSVPVSGVARSGIDSTALVEGRNATIVGIVKRAYPTASDQRFALVPRSPSDIHLGQATAEESGEPGATPAANDPGAPDGSFALPTGWPTGAPTVPPDVAGGAISVTFADLAAHEGARVAVGGSVTSVDGSRIVLDDGTASAVIRLVGDAQAMSRLVSSGDLVNVVGTVQRNAAGGLEVAVDEPQAIRWIPWDIGRLPRGTQGARLSPAPAPSAHNSAPESGAQEGSSFTAMAAVAALLLIASTLFVAAVAATPSNRLRLRTWLQERSNRLRTRVGQMRSS